MAGRSASRPRGMLVEIDLVSWVVVKAALWLWVLMTVADACCSLRIGAHVHTFWGQDWASSALEQWRRFARPFGPQGHPSDPIVRATYVATILLALLPAFAFIGWKSMMLARTKAALRRKPRKHLGGDTRRAVRDLSRMLARAHALQERHDFIKAEIRGGRRLLWTLLAIALFTGLILFADGMWAAPSDGFARAT